MIITISPDRCAVVDADDCTRLHATAAGLDDADAGAALHRANLGGPGDPNHVWLSIDGLRATARTGASSPDWDERFDAMISFARARGWLDATEKQVAAHLERSTP
jgi:hypothetical protein